MRKKTVSTLHDAQGSDINSDQFTTAFTEFYSQLLGVQQPLMTCSLHSLYPPASSLHRLALPFTQEEIVRAVNELASNKASGPDGLPNEFVKTKWDLVKDDILSIFSALHEGTLDLHNSNHAHIILIPKKEVAITVDAFRPISIINYIPKLISKVLAARLVPLLPGLVDQCQSGFVKGRQLHENFIAAREIVSHLASSKDPTIMLKLDFYKAFDTVDWNFLKQVMRIRGLPDTFICWVNMLLSTATSSVVVNNKVGPAFTHKRGLRQGDPLSPLLFILVADVLSRLVKAVATSIHSNISTAIPAPYFLLQYADDTLIFSTTKDRAVQKLKLLLHLFSSCSGLNVNFLKSCFVPFNLSEGHITVAQNILRCQPSALPLPYLGLPLSPAKPDRSVFNSLLEKLQRRLAGWKGQALSRAGRIVLASSVLSSIPIFFMSVFQLPIWLLKEIDKMRRDFIWGTTASNRKIPLLAWDRVCTPKSLGGFGLSNLRLHNHCLLLRWWWKLYAHHDSLWTTLAKNIYGGRHVKPPLLWKKTGSFFWKSLQDCKLLFQISTSFKPGSGDTVSFWFDNWGSGHLTFFHPSHVQPVNPRLSLARASSNAFERPLTRQVFEALLQLGPQQRAAGSDMIFWKWSSNKVFSVSSAYNAFIKAGRISSSSSTCLWKSKVSPTVKVFAVLLSHNRLLTQEGLMRRNLHVLPRCVMCNSDTPETTVHLFASCPFVTTFWRLLQIRFGMRVQVSAGSIEEFLRRTIAGFHPSESETSLSLMLTALWGIWLERNNRLFRNEEKNVSSLVHWVVFQHRQFMKFA